MRSLRSTKPVHFIFIGPPSSAKSILLLCLDQIPGAQMVLGGSLTKVGVRELLLDTRPPVLLIDEIEKVENIKTLSVLLSLMATGIVIDTKSGVHRREVLNTRVFACCNSRHGLSGELLSRFAQFVLRPYTTDEFKNIVVNVLTARESKTPDMAAYIADKVSSVMGSHDVRDALRVARLTATTDDVDKTVGVMRKYSDQLVLVHRDRV
jgi:MoxR-like ATPase